MVKLTGNELYVKYGSFISRYSHKLGREYSWGLDAGEAEQIAWKAALICYKKYNPYNEDGEPVDFENYASIRIRGAILDEVRKRTFLNKSKSSKDKKVFYKKVVGFEDLEETDLQRAMLCTEQDLFKLENITQPNFETLISELKDSRDIDFMRLIYLYELKLVDIAKTYEIDLATVCRRHKTILQMLRKRLSSKKDYL